MQVWETVSTPAAMTCAGEASPDENPLPMGLAGDGGDEVAGQVGVDLDRRRARAVRLGDGDRQVAFGRDGLHPGSLAGDGAASGLVGPGIVEELRTGHQSGVVDIGSGDFAHQGGAGEVGHLAQIVGHVAHGRDPAIEVLFHHRLRPRPVGRGGQMFVAVAETGKDIEPGDVDDLGPNRRRQLRRRRDGLDTLAVDENRHVRPLGAARPVDQRRSAIEPPSLVGGAEWEGAGDGADQRDSAGEEEPT